MEILRRIFVDDDDIHGSARTLHCVRSGIDSTAGEIGLNQRPLSGEREKLHSVEQGACFDNCAGVVGDRRIAVLVSVAMKVNRGCPALRAVEQKVEYPERECIGVTYAAGAAIEVRVALSNPERDSDGIGAGAEQTETIREIQIGSDQVGRRGAGRLAVAAVVVLRQHGQIVLGCRLAKRQCRF